MFRSYYDLCKFLIACVFIPLTTTKGWLPGRPSATTSSPALGLSRCDGTRRLPSVDQPCRLNRLVLLDSSQPSLVTEVFEYQKNVFQLNLDDNAVSELQRRLRAQQHTDDKNPGELIQVEGYVTSQRGFGSSFCFLDLSKRGVRAPVQAMLKRQAFGNATRFDGFMKSIVPGVRLQITGHVAPTRNPGEALILIQDMTIQKLPHNPQHVRKLLKLYNEGLLDAASNFTRAANKTEDELSELLQEAKQQCRPNNPKLFQGLAKKILRDLDGDHENDLEYPQLTSDHKYTHSLAVAASDIRYPPEPVEQWRHLHDTTPTDHNDEMESLLIESVMKMTQQNKTSSSDPIAIRLCGWIQNRRRFQDSITTLELVDEMTHIGTSEESDAMGSETFWNKRLKCVLHPRIWHAGDNKTLANVYGQVLAPGSRILVEGCLMGPRDKDTLEKHPVVWIQRIVFLQASWRPQVVQFLIEQVVDGVFSRREASLALKTSKDYLDRVVKIENLTKRQWESVEIARRLQHDSMDLSLHIDQEQLKVLNQFESLRGKYPLQFVDVAATGDTRSDFVSTQGSRWKRQKEPQLEWMTSQVEGVLKQSYPGRFSLGSSEILRILDVGGGKGFLANQLGRRLLDRGYSVKIFVVDVAEGAVHNGRQRSERRALADTVHYAVADASSVDLRSFGGKVDIVVALHACGGLTDVALGHAVNERAAFVICPCCFCSNPNLSVPSLAQQETISIEKWLQVDSNKYQTLKRLAEIQGDIKLANKAIHSISALRLAAVEKHSASKMKIDIKTFPVAFSTRNFCLVGSLC